MLGNAQGEFHSTAHARASARGRRESDFDADHGFGLDGVSGPLGPLEPPLLCISLLHQKKGKEGAYGRTKRSSWQNEKERVWRQEELWQNEKGRLLPSRPRSAHTTRRALRGSRFHRCPSERVARCSELKALLSDMHMVVRPSQQDSLGVQTTVYLGTCSQRG
jgi:hypothetical protein